MVQVHFKQEARRAHYIKRTPSTKWDSLDFPIKTKHRIYCLAWMLRFPEWLLPAAGFRLYVCNGRYSTVDFFLLKDLIESILDGDR